MVRTPKPPPVKLVKRPAAPPKKAAPRARKPKTAAAASPAVSSTPMVESFDSLVASIRRAGAALDTAFDARVALGRALAARLDDGELEDKSVAGLSKEYRAVICDLVAEVASDPDDDTFGSVLPAQVRHPPQP